MITIETEEQIKGNIRQYLLNNHKDILQTVCMIINDCADCFIESTCGTIIKTYCNPHVETFHVSKESFCIKASDSQRVNRELLDVAETYGYKVGLILENGIVFFKYWK